MNRYVRAITFSALVALGWATSAHAGDELLLPGDRLRTTLAGDGESRIAAAGIAGSQVTLTVKRRGQQGIEPFLRVIDPTGQSIDLTGRLKLSSRRAVAKNVPFETTGVHRIGVSALSGGGDFDLTMKVKRPKKLKLAGELADDADVFETTLDAVPGTRITVALKSKGKPKFTPRLEVLAPDGSLLITVGKAPKPGGVLPDLGTYTLRVSGGPGAFRGVVKVQPPDVRGRELTYADVEAPPHISGIRPATLDNDEVGSLFVDGFGFGGGDIVTVSDLAGRGLVQGEIEQLTDVGIGTDLDLTGLSPGPYAVSVVTPIGTEVVAGVPLIVTNRPPNVRLLGTPATGEGRRAPLTLHGRGFDDDCTVQVRRRGDGLDIPLRVTSRDGPTSLSVELTVPRYAVGEYDVITNDPSGQSRTFVEPLQVLGFSAAEAVILSDPDWGTVFPRSVALDPIGNRLLIGAFDSGRPAFLLVDMSTNTIISSYTAPTLTSTFTLPHVAWDPVNEVWAMTWRTSAPGNIQEPWVRVAAADDLNDVLSHTRLGFDREVTLCTVAANSKSGGFMVTWDLYNPTQGARLVTLPVEPGVEPDLDDRTVIYQDNEASIIFEPTIFDRGDGFFVIVYVATDDLDVSLAMRRTVVRGDGSVLIGSEVLAASQEWFQLGLPKLAMDPNSGTILLVFSFVTETEFHSTLIPLSGGAVVPKGALVPIDEFGVLPPSLANSVVWSAERGEFVVTVTKLGLGITSRRVTADGALRLYNAGEEHEGFQGILFTDRDGARLGMVRAVDGVDDLRTENTHGIQLRLGAFR